MGLVCILGLLVFSKTLLVANNFLLGVFSFCLGVEVMGGFMFVNFSSLVFVWVVNFLSVVGNVLRVGIGSGFGTGGGVVNSCIGLWFGTGRRVGNSSCFGIFLCFSFLPSVGNVSGVGIGSEFGTARGVGNSGFGFWFCTGWSVCNSCGWGKFLCFDVWPRVGKVSGVGIGSGFGTGGEVGNSCIGFCFGMRGVVCNSGGSCNFLCFIFLLVICMPKSSTSISL